MKVKVFEKNEKGKIELTKQELENLLNEVYDEGYREGSSKYWTWTTPHYETTPYRTTITCSSDCNCKSNSISDLKTECINNILSSFDYD